MHTRKQLDIAASWSIQQQELILSLKKCIYLEACLGLEIYAYHLKNFGTSESSDIVGWHPTITLLKALFLIFISYLKFLVLMLTTNHPNDL